MTVITYTMAGGGSHWWNYEVHYDKDGEQKYVYVNNRHGQEERTGGTLWTSGDRLVYQKEQPFADNEDPWFALNHYSE